MVREVCTHKIRDLAKISCEELGLNLGSYAQMPIPRVEDGVLQVIFSSRDTYGRSESFVACLDIETYQVVEKATKLQISLGVSSAFDSKGVMVSSVVKTVDQERFYYVGWNEGAGTPYCLSIGLAEGSINNNSFKKISDQPVVGKSKANPIFVTTPYVVKRNDRYMMFYSNGDPWTEYQGRQESNYSIFVADSNDGIVWNNFKKINLGYEDEIAQARPVLDSDHLYVSHRSRFDFRMPNSGYRISAFKTLNQDEWIECQILWESEEQILDRSYAHPLKIADRNYLFYNGSNFGKYGLTIAEQTIGE